jgi:hypothetical protein
MRQEQRTENVERLHIALLNKVILAAEKELVQRATGINCYF